MTPLDYVVKASAPSERIIDEADKFHILKTQDVEPILKSIQRLPEMQTFKRHLNPLRLKAVIPNVIAVQWARESGTKLYSKDWLAFVGKKLKDPDFQKLRLDYSKVRTTK